MPPKVFTPGVRRCALVIAILATLTAGCASGSGLPTVPAIRDEMKGSYTVYLHGCRYPDQIDNLAVLVLDTSTYPVDIYDLDTSYTVRKNLPAATAFEVADAFVRCSTHRIWQTQLERIPDPGGGTFGYELRPWYFPLEFGMPDVLETRYVVHNGAIRVYITINPAVQRALQPSGNRDRGHDRN